MAETRTNKTFNYTDDLPEIKKAPNHPDVIAERVQGLEDAVSGLQERIALLEAIARKDHPDLVADWPEVDEEG